MSLSRTETWRAFYPLVKRVTGDEKLFVMRTKPQEAPYPTRVVVARPSHLEPRHPDPRVPHFEAGTLGVMVFAHGRDGIFLRFEADRGVFATDDLEAAVRHAHETYHARLTRHEAVAHQFWESDSYINIDD